MSIDPTRTQTIQMVGDHVHDLRRKMENTDSTIVELGKSMIAVQKDTAHVKETTDKLNLALDKLVSVIDTHNEKIKNDIVGLKLFRNWATGIFGCAGAVFLFFKEVIINFLFKGGHTP